VDDPQESKFLKTVGSEADPSTAGRAAPKRDKIGDSGGIDSDDSVKMDMCNKKHGDQALKPSKSPLSPEELEVVRANLSVQEKHFRE